MQNAPALIGDWSIAGKLEGTKMFANITTVEKAKLTMQAALVARFQYRPYRNGARKAPASAPQDTPMSCAMKVTLEAILDQGQYHGDGDKHHDQ